VQFRANDLIATFRRKVANAKDLSAPTPTRSSPTTSPARAIPTSRATCRRAGSSKRSGSPPTKAQGTEHGAKTKNKEAEYV
jgi:hypothetical protein